MDNDAGKPGFIERMGFAVDSITRSLKGDDPCNSLLVKYERCVAAQKDGLSEGNDCSAEGEEYKKCRRSLKSSKKSDA